MYAVVYRWRVKHGAEDIFRQGWREVTEDIRRNFGGGGSRLHKAENGEWWAYARWPSKEMRDRAFAARSGPMSETLKKWNDVTEVVGETWLEITDDLLLPEADLGPEFHQP